jgi:hypothetical protein
LIHGWPGNPDSRTPAPDSLRTSRVTGNPRMVSPVVPAPARIVRNTGRWSMRPDCSTWTETAVTYSDASRIRYDPGASQATWTAAGSNSSTCWAFQSSR